MVSNKKLANAVGGKTARACDSCIRKRASWYCAADDAFLCQTCDASVHSANPLARRHERVRLKTSSSNPPESESPTLENLVPSWHRGFTRKARTPRHGKAQPIHRTAKSEEPIQNSHPQVPEFGGGETSNEENEEQLLYRVPIFDPFVTTDAVGSENGVHGFLDSDMARAEFAADVDSLLGKGLDEETFDMEALGLSGGERVKVEDEEEERGAVMANHVDTEIDMTREPFELSFDFDSPATCEEEDNKQEARVAIMMEDEEGNKGDVKRKKKILLRLDYEEVIRTWANQRSPWTTGNRPELNPSHCWPDFMGSCGTVHHPYGDIGAIGGHASMVDGGREARVSRYREKRRTRLFSKKIRYEVRKLNAEKRPRMKGRFVKRANFLGPAFPMLNK